MCDFNDNRRFGTLVVFGGSQIMVINDDGCGGGVQCGFQRFNGFEDKWQFSKCQTNRSGLGLVLGL